jgi:CheY-like chemotaxis protein
MGRILIVEDDERRCFWFENQFGGHELDVTADVSVAVEWLRSREYDLIFLDHDLADEHYDQELADDGLTGYVVAAWLAANPEYQPGVQIIIHSLNFAGSDRMRRCLLEAGREAEHVPFHVLPAIFPLR